MVTQGWYEANALINKCNESTAFFQIKIKIKKNGGSQDYANPHFKTVLQQGRQVITGIKR